MFTFTDQVPAVQGRVSMDQERCTELLDADGYECTYYQKD